jgi:hypothetical protein
LEAGAGHSGRPLTQAPQLVDQMQVEVHRGASNVYAAAY